MTGGDKRHEEELPKIVEEKARRRQKAEKEGSKPIFFGLGMFGVVGWTIALPTVVGVFLGRWLDGLKSAESKVSWTLSCMFIGLIIGVVAAWQWMSKEGKSD
ncbi:MAG: AtpZ/AtpI family protein [Desulfobulbaceae bacterium]|nr:AtpZ/AtpI family protein [Desulfobulbaceae bacterium]